MPIVGDGSEGSDIAPRLSARRRWTEAAGREIRQWPRAITQAEKENCAEFREGMKNPPSGLPQRFWRLWDGRECENGFLCAKKFVSIFLPPFASTQSSVRIIKGLLWGSQVQLPAAYWRRYRIFGKAFRHGYSIPAAGLCFLSCQHLLPILPSRNLPTFLKTHPFSLGFQVLDSWSRP